MLSIKMQAGYEKFMFWILVTQLKTKGSFKTLNKHIKSKSEYLQIATRPKYDLEFIYTTCYTFGYKDFYARKKTDYKTRFHSVLEYGRNIRFTLSNLSKHKNCFSFWLSRFKRHGLANSVTRSIIQLARWAFLFQILSQMLYIKKVCW